MNGSQHGADGTKTVERKFVIKNKFGIHARPAALFVKTVSQFGSDITIKLGTRLSRLIRVYSSRKISARA